MEFQSDVQKQTYDRVRGMAEKLFTVFAQYNPDLPLIYVQRGSAVAVVHVAPWMDSAVVRVRAYVARDVTADAALYEDLMKRNNQFVFGAFLVDEDGDVAFQQTILGPTIDEDELKHTVGAVVTTADQLDEEVVGRWGGKRAID